MSKKMFIVQTGINNSLEVFATDTIEDRRKMLDWVILHTGELIPIDKVAAAKILEGDLSPFNEPNTTFGFSVPTALFTGRNSAGQHKHTIRVFLGTLGEPT